MSGESSSASKTKQPTRKKQKDARERGQVAGSKELIGCLSIAVVILLFFLGGGFAFSKIQEGFGYLLKQISSENLNLRIIIQDYLLLTLPIGVALIVITSMFTSLVNVVLIGGVIINKEFFKLNFDKLNPAANFKNLFKRENIIKLCLQILMVGIVLTIVCMLIRYNMKDLMNMTSVSKSNMIHFSIWLVVRVIVFSLLIYLLYGVVSWVLERVKLHKELMMTEEEVKREFKETERDPHIKNAQRQLHRELLEGDDYDIENASMVIANPTHIAIAIFYDPKVYELPIVMKKAKNYNAQLIFNSARKHGIPILRFKWLARELFKYAVEGKPVPSSYLATCADFIGKNLHVLPKLQVSLLNKQSKNDLTI